MHDGAIVIEPDPQRATGTTAHGDTLSIGEWTFHSPAHEVAPLHVHREDDEAWHVLTGALQFRFSDGSTRLAEAGSTVLVPAGVAHTFGPARDEPCRYLIVIPSRLRSLIDTLHATDRAQHAQVYADHASELLELP
jgi:quercetin dioxygenase-like cupin family protein